MPRSIVIDDLSNFACHLLDENLYFSVHSNIDECKKEITKCTTIFHNSLFLTNNDKESKKAEIGKMSIPPQLVYKASIPLGSCLNNYVNKEFIDPIIAMYFREEMKKKVNSLVENVVNLKISQSIAFDDLTNFVCDLLDKNLYFSVRSNIEECKIEVKKCTIIFRNNLFTLGYFQDPKTGEITVKPFIIVGKRRNFNVGTNFDSNVGSTSLSIQESNVNSNDESNTRSNEKSNVNSNDETNTRFNEKSNNESNSLSNEESKVKSNDESNSLSNKESNNESNSLSNEESKVKSNDELNSLSNKESYDEFNSLSNKEFNVKSNDESNSLSNEEFNFKSNDESNSLSNEESNFKSNDESNSLSNKESNMKSNAGSYNESDDKNSESKINKIQKVKFNFIDCMRKYVDQIPAGVALGIYLTEELIEKLDIQVNNLVSQKASPTEVFDNSIAFICYTLEENYYFDHVSNLNECFDKINQCTNIFEDILPKSEQQNSTTQLNKP
ncbi:MATH and LRR domain-containing protein PFE0570w-like isoform X2 [Daktulosphaira vitifoliae]|nr:MATH and LRR domain-containing protein PFE0570w-like isoform X2 [Daktulosphaira vitifoliae]XP_050522702.1 MATH and LRR domain-containing protein PFE0570w-like isoform X2 [Daktulosphaira vitifoliae]